VSAPGDRAELYVYYRVGSAQRLPALRLVYDFQQRLRIEYPGLGARVLQRPGERDGSVTLMEIYAYDDGHRRSIDESVRRRIDAAAVVLTPLLAGPRQVEIFEPLD